MDFEKWSDIIPTAIKLPIRVYQHRHSLQKWYKRLLVYFGKGETNIVVLGRSGVGKSVMVAYLYGETNDLSWELPKTSKDIESKAITIGDWTKLVRVIPGQTSQQRYVGLHEALLESEQLEGVIYVTDWGFTDVRDMTVRKQFIEYEGITTVENLRDFNLKAELDDLKSVCEKIKESFALGKPPKWFLILVNKADLFYPNLDEAQLYYHPKGNSPFSKVIQALLHEIGEQNLKSNAIPICSFEKNLVWNNETMITQIGGEENRKALLHNFFTTVSNF